MLCLCAVDWSLWNFARTQTCVVLSQFCLTFSTSLFLGATISDTIFFLWSFQTIISFANIIWFTIISCIAISIMVVTLWNGTHHSQINYELFYSPSCLLSSASGFCSLWFLWCLSFPENVSTEINGHFLVLLLTVVNLLNGIQLCCYPSLVCQFHSFYAFVVWLIACDCCFCFPLLAIVASH